MSHPIPAYEPGAEERELELIALEKELLASTTEHGHEEGIGGAGE